MNSTRYESSTARKPAAQFDIPSGIRSSSSASINVPENESNVHPSNVPFGSAGGKASFSPLTTTTLTNQKPSSVAAKTKDTPTLGQTQDTPTLGQSSQVEVDQLVSYFTETLAITKENSQATLTPPPAMENSGIADNAQPPQDLVSHLQSQLEAAKVEIARKDKELFQHKVREHTIDMNQDMYNAFQTGRALPRSSGPSPGLAAYPGRAPINTEGLAPLSRNTTMSPGPVGRFQGPWGNGLGVESAGFGPVNQQQFNPTGLNQSGTLAWPNHGSRSGLASSTRYTSAPQPQRPHNLRLDALEVDPSFANAALEHGVTRTSQSAVRSSSAVGPQYNIFGNYQPPNVMDYSPSMSPMSLHHMQGQQPGQFQYPRLGSPLSPVAKEFNGSGYAGVEATHHAAAWNTQAGQESPPTYVASMEPMNYRRLLDRNMSCNWSYVVDKIVLSNDQQASIFLQQKLKSATPEQKHDLVEAIVKQAYPLMINRFGNFLIQRCFEHGTPDQVVAIAKTIQCHVLELSTDAFGCHVVQKALDVVPESYKATFVIELLHDIPDTVIHRYACHVWQKLFELRWADTPPQIMLYVNEALRGMWHEVALGETGSLVVQNIFENCLEEDKRPCISEVLGSIDIIAHGQFGNWCIQHICEHGAPNDKKRAIEHVLRYSTEYSTDQFASKVVEKCLKVGGAEFLERYLERVCEARADRPRMPLIDIAGDQYGNYLIQYILIHAHQQHREIVANHVRKHLVSLRGSKFGSRVALLCCNPASTTRPGPPMGMQLNNRFAGMSMAYPRSNSAGAYR